MAFMRIKHLKRWKHPKSGKWYTYDRLTGERLEPPHEYGSPEFMAALLEGRAKHERRRRNKQRTTFGDLVRSYRASPGFQVLRPKTQRDYLSLLDSLAGIDGMAADLIDPPFLVKLRNKVVTEHGWRSANLRLSAVSVVFGHAIETGVVKQNPAIGVKRAKRPAHAPQANRAWTEEEKRAVLSRAPKHLVIPISIARWTGMRQGDILNLPKTAYKEGAITIITAKRSVPLWFPCPQALKLVLDGIEANDSLRLCVNSSGTPWTSSGFRCSFRKLIRKLEKEGAVGPGLTFHGLRTSFAEELRGMGFDSRTISDVLAQNDPKSAEHYTRGADRRQSAVAVTQALDGTEGAQKLSTLLSN